jgi:predicted DNA-binding protein YlxM (UPF0122 family)
MPEETQVPEPVWHLKRLMTIKEFAEHRKVTRKAIYHHIKITGDITVEYVGKSKAPYIDPSKHKKVTFKTL